MADSTGSSQPLAISERQIEQFLDLLERVSARRTVARALDPPPDDSREQEDAEFGHRLLSALLGRSANALASEIAIATRSPRELTISLVDRYGKVAPAPERTIVELAVAGTSQPVSGELDGRGAFTLPGDIRDTAIDHVFVREPGGRVIAVVSHVDPPPKMPRPYQQAGQRPKQQPDRASSKQPSPPSEE
jgi:hypothetical protein